ncbi:MAG: 3-deoxy-D-manno-octulosonic acid transferase, partial [Chitinophagaceae bacterium]
MAVLFYNFFIYLYGIGARLLAPFNPKAKLWLNGRKKLFARVEREWRELQKIPNRGPVIWMHCASLGEFEQGRPIIEGIKQHNRPARIIITFFSPSGYEIRKNYAGADLICYLPIDSAKNARRFVDLIRPDVVLWVKYEYWYYFLRELKNRNIPLILISG